LILTGKPRKKNRRKINMSSSVAWINSHGGGIPQSPARMSKEKEKRGNKYATGALPGPRENSKRKATRGNNGAPENQRGGGGTAKSRLPRTLKQDQWMGKTRLKRNLRLERAQRTGKKVYISWSCPRKPGVFL